MPYYALGCAHVLTHVPHVIRVCCYDSSPDEYLLLVVPLLQFVLPRVYGVVFFFVHQV